MLQLQQLLDACRKSDEEKRNRPLGSRNLIIAIDLIIVRSLEILVQI